jgi:DNA repair protein RecO (recombination protein O)
MCARCGRWDMSEALDTAVKPRRRSADARVDHQPAFVLHGTPWRETSLIVEMLTRDHGRVALVARGAKRPTSHFRGLLSPFNPLAVGWSGRNEIKTLVRAEWLGGMQPLRGDALLAAFYANELLVRLLARFDPHERLFAGYVELLQALSHEQRHDAALRGFELDLLADVGYAVPLDRCVDGAPIDADSWYRFDAGHGAQRIEPRAAADSEPVRGRTLLAMAVRDFGDERCAAEAKALLRRLIRYHLGGRPLNTRRILQDLKQLA